MVEDILKTFEHKTEVWKNKGIKINEQNYRHDNHKYYKEFIEFKNKNLDIKKTEELSDGKILKVFSNGLKEISFSNGAKKYKFPNKFQIVNFANGDVK